MHHELNRKRSLCKVAEQFNILYRACFAYFLSDTARLYGCFFVSKSTRITPDVVSGVMRALHGSFVTRVSVFDMVAETRRWTAFIKLLETYNRLR